MHLGTPSRWQLWGTHAHESQAKPPIQLAGTGPGYGRLQLPRHTPTCNSHRTRPWVLGYQQQSKRSVVVHVPTRLNKFVMKGPLPPLSLALHIGSYSADTPGLVDADALGDAEGESLPTVGTGGRWWANNRKHGPLFILTLGTRSKRVLAPPPNCPKRPTNPPSLILQVQLEDAWGSLQSQDPC